MASSLSILRTAFCPSFLIAVLLFAFCSHIASAAVISSPNALSLKTDNLVEFHCVHERQWTDVRYFQVKDCFGAMYFMLHAEGAEPWKPEVLMEFKTRGAASTKPFGEPLITPRKYVIGESSFFSAWFCAYTGKKTVG